MGVERGRERQADTDTDSHRERTRAPNYHTTTIAQLVGTRGENDDLYITSC